MIQYSLCRILENPKNFWLLKELRVNQVSLYSQQYTYFLNTESVLQLFKIDNMTKITVSSKSNLYK